MSKVKSQKSKVWKRRFFINTLLVGVFALSTTFVFAQTPAKPATAPTASPKPATGAPTTTPAKPTNPATPNATPDTVSSLSAPTGGLQLGADQRQPLNLFLRNSKTVKALWSTILRIADTFVVLFLLAIAFATILHISYDTYGIKKAILPLIIGIILSHFSLVIVQNFTDFAQVMGAGMYNAASSGQGASGMATNISNTFFTGGLKALEPTGGEVTAVALIGLFTFAFVVPASAGAIFLGLLALALIMIAIPTLLILVLSFLLYARFYLITVLTIIAPLAWLTIMWSPVQGFLKTWWKQFTQWVFMAPVAIFFLWLAIAFSQSSIANGEANFGTYLLSLVMLYLAIQTPFKMGGQVTATMSKYAQSKALPVAKKAVGSSVNAGLNAWGQSNVPFGKNKGKQWSQAYGVMGLDAMKEGAKLRWGQGTATNRAANAGTFVGLGPGGNKQRAEQLRKKAQQERIDSEQFATGTGADRIQRIEDGSIKNPEDALTMIEMMAQKGEDAMGALEAYIKNSKYNKDGKDPRDKDPNFAKRWNNAVMYTKPWLMHTTNPGDKPADTATAEEKAAYAEKKKPIDDQQRVIDAWVNFENVMKNSAKELGKVGRIDDTHKSAVEGKITEKINEMRASGATSTDIKGVTYTNRELVEERDRINRSTNATATHLDLGDITVGGTKIEYNGGEQNDLLRRIRNNPAMCQTLEDKGAASPITAITNEVIKPPRP